MKASRRARRMRRHYSRMNRTGGLNLVSLMDIFTILVFFLMVNSSDVKVMQSSTDVSLPVSTSKNAAVENLTVQIVGNSILVQGREIARLNTIDIDDTDVPELFEELAYQRDRWAEVPKQGLTVTIMAGKETHYRLLRKIIQTCVDAQFRQVRLAVEAEVGDG